MVPVLFGSILTCNILNKPRVPVDCSPCTTLTTFPKVVWLNALVKHHLHHASQNVKILLFCAFFFSFSRTSFYLSNHNTLPTFFFLKNWKIIPLFCFLSCGVSRSAKKVKTKFMTSCRFQMFKFQRVFSNTWNGIVCERSLKLLTWENQRDHTFAFFYKKTQKRLFWPLSVGVCAVITLRFIINGGVASRILKN